MQSKYKNFFLTFIWSKQSMDTFWDEIIIKQNETPFRRWNGPSTTWFHSRTCLVIKVLMDNKPSYYHYIMCDQILECLIDSFLNSVFLGYNLARYPIPGDGVTSRSNRNRLKWWWWWKTTFHSDVSLFQSIFLYIAQLFSIWIIFSYQIKFLHNYKLRFCYRYRSNLSF